MMNQETQKALMGAKAFKGFCEQFGKDIYSRILLEELLEGLYHEETVFVLGEQGEEGDQTGDGASDGESNGSEVDGFEDTGSSADLG